jgi:hypothetical protein
MRGSDGGSFPHREAIFLMSNEFDIIPVQEIRQKRRMNSPRAGGPLIAFDPNN